MATVIELLYGFSRTHPGSALISWMFRNMSFVLPLEISHETNTLLAFYHPRPSHSFHVVLVPKQQIISLEGLSPQDHVFLSDIFSTVRTLVNQFDLARDGYRLIANGGKHQEFGLLHFHLISDVVQGSS